MGLARVLRRRRANTPPPSCAVLEIMLQSFGREMWVVIRGWLSTVSGVNDDTDTSPKGGGTTATLRNPEIFSAGLTYEVQFYRMHAALELIL